ncbi:hypothetical protein [Chryseobacterium sp. MYb328]|uniref:hypothetical protein n=1 Tax=Chryseobacterium sp. MYb328 TaxID=2745231 RepID=UPI0030A6838C
MDRNYFLSYGQIAFLLLLSTIGRLNARIISSTVSKPELFHRADITDSDFYLHLSDIFSQKSINSVSCRSAHHLKINDNFQDAVLPGNIPFVNDQNFVLFSVKNLKFTSDWNKWRWANPVHHTNPVAIFEMVKTFDMNSFKLVDGFKFIIKIPDKLTVITIQ